MEELTKAELLVLYKLLKVVILLFLIPFGWIYVTLESYEISSPMAASLFHKCIQVLLNEMKETVLRCLRQKKL